MQPDAADTTAVPQPRPLAFMAGLGVVLLFVVVSSIGMGLVHAAGGTPTVRGGIGVTEALSLAAVQAFGALAVGAAVLLGLSSRAALGPRATRKQVLRGIELLLPVGLLVILPGVAYTLATDGPLIASGIDVQLALALVLLASLIAIAEELWFRGLVLQALGAPARIWFVVFASAVLFGAPHLTNEPATWLNSAAVTLAVGIPFAVVRLTTTALLPLIIWHAIIDIWAFLHTARVTATGDPTLTEVLAGLALPAAIALGYMLWLRRHLRAAAPATPSAHRPSTADRR